MSIIPLGNHGKNKRGHVTIVNGEDSIFRVIAYDGFISVLRRGVNLFIVY